MKMFQTLFVDLRRPLISTGIFFAALLVFIALSPSPSSAQSSDTALNAVRRQDQADRTANNGQLIALEAREHHRRAAIYLANRAFGEARAHWQLLLQNDPDNELAPAAWYGIGRSYFLPQKYKDSMPFYARLVSDFPATREGRDGLTQLAAAYLRTGNPTKAAELYQEYTARYPDGEKIESSYLNVIDSWREAGRNAEALKWVTITRNRFPSTATETNAVFAELRLQLAAHEWARAVTAADALRTQNLSRKDVLTNFDEAAFLRAYALERGGRKADAINAYLAIPDRLDAYHGALATERLSAIPEAANRPDVQSREAKALGEARRRAGEFPTPFSAEVLRAANSRRIDPRLLLAIMKQESGFRARAKSPAAARGLLQLTIDTARKYAPGAGFPNLREDDLYQPSINAAIGSEYVAALARMFPETPEAVIASYNGGEDNIARWLKRANSREGALFTAEVGFDETKDYVFKVMGNYRAYRELYTASLQPK